MNLSSLKQKYWLSVILVLAIIGLMIAGINYCQGYTQQTNAPQKPSSTNFLRVKGDKIIDEKGNEIILRGIDVDPFEYYSFKGEENKDVYTLERINQFNLNLYKTFITEEDIRAMKNLGANVIRKQISFYHLEIEPYKYNDGVLAQLDYLINISSRNGIYVIPSLTAAAQNSEQMLAHPESEVSKAYNNAEHLWAEPEFQKRVLAAWKHIAEHYANEPGIAGYDIINEPSAPTKEDLHSFYSKVISEIRKVDTKHIIILEKQHFHNSEFLFGGIYNEDNIMLSLHRYPGEKFNPKAKYETYNDFYKGMGDFLKNEEVKGHPLYVGEFGIHYSKDEAHEWLDNFMQVMNLYGVHYTFFSYKNVYGYWDKLEGGSKGLYLSTEPLLSVPQNIPKEQVIDWAEKRKDQLLTERFKIDLKINKILKQRLNGPAVTASPPSVQVRGRKQ